MEWGVGWMNTKNEVVDLWGSESILQDTIMVDTHYYKFANPKEETMNFGDYDVSRQVYGL